MLRITMTRLACVLLGAALAACGSAPVAPGYYRVERGDTLTKIARNHRQSVQNIVRWNNLSNPDAIEVGQTLRVEPERGSATAMSGANSTASSSNASASGESSRAPASKAA